MAEKLTDVWQTAALSLSATSAQTPTTNSGHTRGRNLEHAGRADGARCASLGFRGVVLDNPQVRLTNVRDVLYIQLMAIRRTALHLGEQCLVMRVRRLARCLTRMYDKELRPLGIGSAQLNLLVALGAAGALRASDIGAHLDIEKSTLSRTLARLAAQGFVESDEDQRLRLTAAGERILGDSRPAWQRAQARAARALGDRLTQALSEIAP